MIPKKSAHRAADAILDKEYDALGRKRRRTLAIRYRNILLGELMHACGHDPKILASAIRYSHSRWQVYLWKKIGVNA